MAREKGVVPRTMFTMVPALSKKTISSGNGVFSIHIEMARFVSNINSMPVDGAKSVRCISPIWRSSGSSATSIMKRTTGRETLPCPLPCPINFKNTGCGGNDWGSWALSAAVQMNARHAAHKKSTSCRDLRIWGIRVFINHEIACAGHRDNKRKFDLQLVGRSIAWHLVQIECLSPGESKSRSF